MQINKVLIVDDDQSIRRIGELSLSRVGKWQVSLASSAVEALALISKEKPDVILLDVMMPSMDGPTCLAKIRECVEYQKTPVIFMTAKVQRHEVDKYLEMDAAGVISKPFDPVELPNEIQTIVNRTAR